MKENVTSIQAASSLENSLFTLRGLRANYYLDSDSKWLKEFDNSIKEFFFWHENALKSASTIEEKMLLKSIAIKFEEFLNLHERIIDLLKGNPALGKKLLLDDSYSLFNQIYNDCENLIAKNQELINTI